MKPEGSKIRISLFHKHAVEKLHLGRTPSHQILLLENVELKNPGAPQKKTAKEFNRQGLFASMVNMRLVHHMQTHSRLFLNCSWKEKQNSVSSLEEAEKFSTRPIGSSFEYTKRVELCDDRTFCAKGPSTNMSDAISLRGTVLPTNQKCHVMSKLLNVVVSFIDQAVRHRKLDPGLLRGMCDWQLMEIIMTASRNLLIQKPPSHALGTHLPNHACKEAGTASQVSSPCRSIEHSRPLLRTHGETRHRKLPGRSYATQLQRTGKCDTLTIKVAISRLGFTSNMALPANTPWHRQDHMYSCKAVEKRTQIDSHPKIKETAACSLSCSFPVCCIIRAPCHLATSRFWRRGVECFIKGLVYG